MMHVGNVDQLIREAEALHSAPGIAQSLLNLTRHADFDVGEVVDCLQRDPALSARLLRVLNSPRYGLRQPVRNLKQAVMLLGRRTLRLMTLSFSMLEVFSRGPARSLYTDYWRQAITMAMAGMRLVDGSEPFSAHDAYMAGLLAHLGTLLLAQVRPDEYLPIFQKAKTGAELVKVEREAFGFDHAELGACLLDRWGLPEELAVAVRDHHLPAANSLAELVHSGELLADVLWKPETASVETAHQWMKIHHGINIDEFITLAHACSEEVKLEAEIYGIVLDGPLDIHALLDAAHQQYLEFSLEAALDLDSLTAVLKEPDPLL